MYRHAALTLVLSDYHNRQLQKYDDINNNIIIVIVQCFVTC